jgi:hypothetical protein
MRIFLIAASAALLCAGCEGSAEKAGENMDNQIEEAAQGERNLEDGAMEQAGEAIDEATGKERADDGADALNDATDGDPDSN